MFSRLAWPGYQVSNATVVDPVDDYLLTVRVSPDDANSEISYPLRTAALAPS